MFLLALGATCLATALDLRSRRIPNAIPGGLFIVALLMTVTGRHPLGVHQAIFGFVAACLVALPTFAKGWLGGGDAKLLMALGLTLGLVPFCAFAITTSVAGGVLALRLRGQESPEMAYAPAMLLGLLALLPFRWLN